MQLRQVAGANRNLKPQFTVGHGLKLDRLLWAWLVVTSKPSKNNLFKMPNNLCLASPPSLYYTVQWRLTSISSKLITQLVANISLIPIIEPIVSATLQGPVQSICGVLS